MKQLSVSLRVFKGKESYDREGKLLTANHLVTLEYGVKSWDNFLANARNLGYQDAIVEKVSEIIYKTGTMEVEELEAIPEALFLLQKVRKNTSRLAFALFIFNSPAFLADNNLGGVSFSKPEQLVLPDQPL